MGTNFYHYAKPPCEHCGALDESTERHIGKSSAGWCFSLHVYPDDGITRLEDWLPLWREGHIQDEYGSAVTFQEMLDRVTKRRRDDPWQDRWWQFGEFYQGESDFHRRNHSERGPNGMLRHQVDGRHCIGHGEGTWDYIVGEFS